MVNATHREIEAKLAALNGPQGGADAVVRLQASSKAAAAAPLPQDSQSDLASLEKQWLAKVRIMCRLLRGVRS